MHAPAFTTANAASAAQAAWLIALIGLATAWPALAQGGGEGASDAQIMAQAMREAKAYQRGASGPMGASPPSGQPLQPALLAPVFQSAAQARSQAGVTLRFTAQAPARFAGRRLALEKATRDQCYTDALLRPGAACRSVTPEAMDRIVQGQQWYARNQASADEQQRIYKQRSAQSDAPCQEWMAALPPDFTVLHIDQPARIGQGKRLQGIQLKGDDSGGGVVYHVQARINQPEKPVVLLLTSYYPTIWQISRSPQTRIAAVWASGYHRQYPIGTDEQVPVLTTSHDEPRCKSHRPQGLPPFASQAQKFSSDRTGEVLIGNPSARWISHGHIASLQKGSDELHSGQGGMAQLLQRGIVRQVTEREYAANREQRGQRAYLRNQPDAPVQDHYRILQGMRFPSGMYGGYSAHFYVPEGVPLPEGDVGHNSIYLLPSGYCLGICP
ncbi:hypothetical protein [Vandammella animalimorsus]|uniref:Uncharacterized protein n=1 Tax=Vandammella animalimorsus TaxID=2029117 RepID=A0A2A2AEG0_9BURK|nr:hypothetical protein [Vandammella animalimorsus]PAT36177.1 hypothetical protein CK620_02920 [Vandammella animalimorsus]